MYIILENTFKEYFIESKFQNFSEGKIFIDVDYSEKFYAAAVYTRNPDLSFKAFLWWLKKTKSCNITYGLHQFILTHKRKVIKIKKVMSR